MILAKSIVYCSKNEQMKNNKEYLDILRQIKNKPNFTQRQLAKKLGISLGKLNYLVRTLTKKGFIKVRNFKTNPNKSDYLYLLTPKGFEMKLKLTLNFMKRMIKEYDELKSEVKEGKKKV